MPFERSFETLLWNSRLIVLVAVVASLAVALAMFYVATVDVVSLIVSRIDVAEESEFAERLLLIRSLDDLKDGLAKVVLPILVVSTP